MQEMSMLRDTKREIRDGDFEIRARNERCGIEMFRSERKKHEMRHRKLEMPDRNFKMQDRKLEMRVMCTSGLVEFSTLT